jgi:hypothetical protein
MLWTEPRVLIPDVIGGVFIVVYVLQLYRAWV